MKILILGGNSMLGHQLLCSWQGRHDVKVTLQNEISDYGDSGLFTRINSYGGIDGHSIDELERIMQDFSPDAVVNTIHVTKQWVDKSNIIPTIKINALFPHCLAVVCGRHNARLVHMSTDCIFSGRTGFYDENAISDAEDLYGRSKFLGEVDMPHVITLRKSIIGLELPETHGLVEWFLGQKGKIRGYRKWIHSGFISSEFARVIEDILINQTTLSGIWNVASEPISKYDLLVQLSQRLGRKDIEIEPDDNFICDRSLNGSAFREQTGYVAPSWAEMLDELVVQIEERKK